MKTIAVFNDLLNSTDGYGDNAIVVLKLMILFEVFQPITHFN